MSTEGDTSSHAVAAAIHGTCSIRLSHLYPPPAVGPRGRVRCPPQLPLVSKSPAYTLSVIVPAQLWFNPFNIYFEHLCPLAVQNSQLHPYNAAQGLSPRYSAAAPFECFLKTTSQTGKGRRSSTRYRRPSARRASFQRGALAAAPPAANHGTPARVPRIPAA